MVFYCGKEDQQLSNDGFEESTKRSMGCKTIRQSILDEIQCDYSFVVMVDNQNLTYFGQAS